MPIHIDINEIRVFKAVYDNNGFKKAADKLFVTQSAVSQTIANLEHKLDGLLLQRNPLKLTEAGVRLLNYAEIVLNEERAVLEDIKNIRNGILSTLLLAMNGSVSTLYGSDLVGKYFESSPLTRIKINVMPSREIITAVSSDLWELGFGPFQRTMPDVFQTIPLFSDERILMIDADYPELDKLLAVPSRVLAKVPLIVSHLDDQDMRPALQKLRDSFGTIWEINDTELRMEMVRKGMGMSYLDQRMLAATPGCENLIPLHKIENSTIPLQFGIYHHKGKTLSSGANRFIEMSREFDFG